MVKKIADKVIESDEEDGEDGEGEVITLAKKCLELMNASPPKSLMEG
jgi:vacuolar protein 8